jgi:DNA-binding CsgD family transcriptional regulator
MSRTASVLELSHVIGAIGTPAFEHAFLDMARRSMRCTHLTAFSFSDAERPRTLLAANAGHEHAARHMASKYIANYWQLDPANIILKKAPEVGQGSTIRLQSHEIEDQSYHRDCYSAANLIDRFSIAKSIGNDIIRLNFYRNETQGRFSDASLDALSDFGEVLVQIVCKHDALRSPVRTQDKYNQYCKRLMLGAPYLSMREMQVCAYIALGLGSEGIAGELDLSINTIFSHRRRAYAKLNISSQNELLHLLLH